MSEKFEVSKKIEIDVDGNTVIFSKLIELQIDYCECEDCGAELAFTPKSDSYGDIQITVERCKCKDVASED